MNTITAILTWGFSAIVLAILASAYGLGRLLAEEIRSFQDNRAALLAEYLPLARSLKDADSEESFRRANQLSWQLAMVLPPNLYKMVGKALSKPDEDANVATVIAEMRELLLKDGTQGFIKERLIVHAPGIGKPITNVRPLRPGSWAPPDA